MKILVIEDHPKIRENIIKFLKISGYLPEWAFNGEEALEKIAFNKYDILVLDINMPIMDGREFMKKLRNNGSNIPVIALSSNSMLDDKLEMFELWVDDYLTKPFELKELEMRIKAIAKRKDKTIENYLEIGDIKIDFAKHKIYKNNIEIEISNKHYLIVEFLFRNKWFPKSKVAILEKVWGELEENLDLNSTTLEAHISVLRKKISKDFIKTIKWVGYIIE